MKVVCLVLPGPPRTKKTSNRIVGIGRPCRMCGKKEHQKVMPSDAHEEWFATMMTYAPAVRSQIVAQGLDIPIEYPVAVRALVYRDANQGDFTGYANAIGDLLQAPRFKDGKTTREGLGIIDDDRQIQHWDGTRLLKDASNPRIEIELTILEEWATQQELALVGKDQF